MHHPFEYRKIDTVEDLSILKRLDAQCFIGTPQMADTYAEQVGQKSFRGLYQGNALVGGLTILPMGQWYGGKRVSMAGIASVGIAPEHRGGGSAIALMRSAVRELFADQVAVSVLYPATQRLYRKAGYEQGGTYCGWEIRADHIQLHERSLPLHPIAPDPDLLNSIYKPYAQRFNGLCDRHRSIWLQKVQAKENEPLYAYSVGPEDNPQGYIVFRQHREQGDGVLTVADWAAHSADAARSLWSFLSGHRSQIETIRWRGGVGDPMLPLLPEQSARMTFIELWMLRIVNLTLALEQRGYPLHLDAELHLQVEDELISENSGSFVLRVAGGAATVEPGGRGELALPIQSLASLYTGLFPPAQLQWMGRLEGTDASVAIATQLFAGSPPWQPDFF